MGIMEQAIIICIPIDVESLVLYNAKTADSISFRVSLCRVLRLKTARLKVKAAYLLLTVVKDMRLKPYVVHKM